MSSCTVRLLFRIYAEFGLGAESRIAGPVKDVGSSSQLGADDILRIVMRS